MQAGLLALSFCVAASQVWLVYNRGMANQIKQTSQVSQTKTSDLCTTGLVFAFLMPPVGAVLSLIGLIWARKHNLNGQKAAIFGIVWGLVWTVPYLLFFQVMHFEH